MVSLRLKRKIKFVAIAISVSVLTLAALFAMIIGPLQSAPASQILNGIYFVSDCASTIAIVPTGANQVLLVDSGMDGAAVQVLAELAILGMSEKSVIAILFMHGHVDHVGGAKRFPHAELLALQSEVDLIGGLTGPRGPVTRWFPVSATGLKVERVLQDNETVTVGSATVKVFAVPGHTMGSAAYLIDGVLFLGDSANATSSGKLQSATWLFSDDLRLNEASLRSLATRLSGHADTVQAIAFGHSGTLVRGLEPLIEWAEDHPD